MTHPCKTMAGAAAPGRAFPLARLSLLGLLLASGAVQAAGYRFGHQSAAAEGTANASGAEGADASTIFANPAALTRLAPGWQISSVLDRVSPKVKFTDAGSTIALPGSGLQPRPTATAGTVQDNVARAAWVPHFYAAYKPSSQLAYGLGEMPNPERFYTDRFLPAASERQLA